MFAMCLKTTVHMEEKDKTCALKNVINVPAKSYV